MKWLLLGCCLARPGRLVCPITFSLSLSLLASPTLPRRGWTTGARGAHPRRCQPPRHTPRHTPRHSPRQPLANPFTRAHLLVPTESRGFEAAKRRPMHAARTGARVDRDAPRLGLASIDVPLLAERHWRKLSSSLSSRDSRSRCTLALNPRRLSGRALLPLRRVPYSRRVPSVMAAAATTAALSLSLSASLPPAQRTDSRTRGKERARERARRNERERERREEPVILSANGRVAFKIRRRVRLWKPGGHWPGLEPPDNGREVERRC
jgi:hypothetical protein